ncbi:hypothetical protein [Massilia aerilata]|uniref:Uncharacterized protein n=1 Tax=Massilia aerilata TaxID=453817 RepID=A0ABW0RY54_9BURK
MSTNISSLSALPGMGRMMAETQEEMARRYAASLQAASPNLKLDTVSAPKKLSS